MGLITKEIYLFVVFSFVAVVSLILIIYGAICLNNAFCSTLRPHNIILISAGVIILIMAIIFYFVYAYCGNSCVYFTTGVILAAVTGFCIFLILVLGFASEMAFFNTTDGKAVGAGILFSIPTFNILMLLGFLLATTLFCCISGNRSNGMVNNRAGGMETDVPY